MSDVEIIEEITEIAQTVSKCKSGLHRIAQNVNYLYCAYNVRQLHERLAFTPPILAQAIV